MMMHRYVSIWQWILFGEGDVMVVRFRLLRSASTVGSQQPGFSALMFRHLVYCVVFVSPTVQPFYPSMFKFTLEDQNKFFFAVSNENTRIHTV
jgi:hypothetical protein